MNYARIMSRVLNQPLLMSPANLTTFISALSDRVGIESLQLGDGTVLDQQEMRATSAKVVGRGVDTPYAVDEGVAILPVVGTLVNKSGNVQPRSGMTGYDGIEARIWQALDDPNVDSILLDIDSGGGELAGCMDCADFVNEAKAIKPIWAYAGDFAASAAFAIGAAADKLFLPRTGTVGSVGVVVAHKSMEEALDNAGIKVTLIHSGDRKVDGNPYEDLPEEVREDIQSSIDKSRQLFAERVAVYRSLPVSAVLNTEAAVYSGQDAVAVGFATGVNTFNEVLGMLKKGEQVVTAVIGATASASTIKAEVEEIVAADKVLVALDELAADIEDGGEDHDDAEKVRVDADHFVAGMVAPAPAADAMVVIEACAAAELPDLAVGMISEGFTEEQVSTRLVVAEEINSLCVAAGVDAADILANISYPVELVTTMLGLHDDIEIDSTHSAVISEEKPSQGMTTAEIWKHRKDESANNH